MVRPFPDSETAGAADCGGASGAAAAKAQGACVRWRAGSPGTLPPECMPSTEQMTKPAAAGIQPSGNSARSTIAHSARLTAIERKVARLIQVHL